jgi:hypothetical protein
MTSTHLLGLVLRHSGNCTFILVDKTTLIRKDITNGEIGKTERERQWAHLITDGTMKTRKGTVSQGRSNEGQTLCRVVHLSLCQLLLYHWRQRVVLFSFESNCNSSS